MLTIQAIAQAIGAALEGDGQATIRGASAVDSAGEGEITFVIDAQRARQLPQCRASAVVARPDVPVPPGMAALRVADPEAAFAQVLGLLAPPEDLPPAGIHPSAVVDGSAQLGRGVAIGPHVVVGPKARLGDGVVLCANVSVAAEAVIGDGTVLFPGVVVRERCVIGRRCRIHPNAVIGADGFGYTFREGAFRKVVHIGRVEIGDDVEIGACACVDRAKFGATRIGDGTKIDNLVQIAHNVQIGRSCALAAMVGIAGSAVLGNYVVLGGHVGVRDNIRVGDGVQVAAFSALGQDMEPGAVVGGILVNMPIALYRRALQMQPRLPDMWKQLKQLQARLDALEQSADNDRE